MLRAKVDIMMIRTSYCGGDPRVEKFIFHYGALGVKIGISCFTRGNPCSRESTNHILHRTQRSIPFRLIDKMPKLVRRGILYVEFLMNILRLVGQWKPKVVHGCDLDGYLLAKFSHGLGRKKIFEVYDPWSTMTGNKRISRVESRAFRKCDVLVMSAQDSRIKVDREHATFLGNEVDIDLANYVLSSAGTHEILNSEYFKKPYILVGGTLSESIGISQLIRTIIRFPQINLLVASTHERLSQLYGRNLPENVICVGLQNWGDWLWLVKNSNFVWVYYDVKNFHYASHISPNKYWEASLYNRPMFVYEGEQFCDRVIFEGQMIELGQEIEESLSSYLDRYIESECFNVQIQTDKNALNWVNVQTSRRQNVAEILQWVELL